MRQLKMAPTGFGAGLILAAIRCRGPFWETLAHQRFSLCPTLPIRMTLSWCGNHPAADRQDAARRYLTLFIHKDFSQQGGCFDGFR